MVREFNIVPENEILDKYGYKEIYNSALMQIVNRRITKFKKGDLGLEDFTIKGSIPFLKALKDRGAKLYLVSGTDESDVRCEAEVLGYSELFNGGIYGALNEEGISTKKKVIQRIIKDNRLSGYKLAAVGDGPVELREAIKVNGIAIGIASDEIRRHGLNTMKRGRLIKAGAQIVMPDFSNLGLLYKLFGCSS
jgi:phosphoglycolate phosphatase-like HAD superfamily hydrolase